MNKSILGVIAACLVSFLILLAGGIYFLSSSLAESHAQQSMAVFEYDAAKAEALEALGSNGAADHLADVQFAPDQVDGLLARIAHLEDQVAALRSDLERTPLAAGAGAADTTAGQIAAVERDAILTVLAEERERQAAERQTEREQRGLQALLGRASRVAETLGLGADDEKVLADLMLSDQEKRRGLMDDMRGLRNEPNGQELIRDGWQAYQEERRSELSSAFGTDLAEQILKLEGPGGDRRGGGFGSDRSPGDNGPNGNSSRGRAGRGRGQ
jgi:hypothetical protein